MKIEKVLGTLPENPEKEVDYICIDWYNACKKIQRLTSKKGREVGISLDEHTAHHGLKENDILWEEEDFFLAVEVLPCEVLVVSGEDAPLIPKICYEIGNRHAPFFYHHNHKDFITPYDKPIQVMLKKIGASVKVETLKINLNHNISSSHGGGHSHSH
ncbi:MAG: urease accessory protein UreE [Eubacteriales bacterium]